RQRLFGWPRRRCRYAAMRVRIRSRPRSITLSRQGSAVLCGQCSRCLRRNLTGRRIIIAEYWGIKVEEIFNSMKERFRSEGAKDVDAVFGYDIEDEGKWKLIVKNDEMKIEKTDDLSGCVAIMKVDGETFVGVNTGKVDATNAFMSGKVKVEGDLGAFGKTGKLFRK